MQADGPYTPIKIHLSFREQVLLLQSRGMSIADPAAAEDVLRRVGYYRLAGYWHPLRLAGGDQFIPGSTFELVYELCEFDRRLRLLVLNAVERVEVAVRVDVAYLLGKKHRLAHALPTLLDARFCSERDHKTNQTGHESWTRKLQEAISKSKEDFVTHHTAKYGGRMPIWVVTELWDFGLLSRFFSGMQYKDQNHIAVRYAAGDGSIFRSWLRAINYIRNVAAHHSRLWNRNIVDRPRFPRGDRHHLLNHLISDSHAQTRVYGLLCILQYMVRTISPADEWRRDVSELAAKFPHSALVDLRQAGFPRDWHGQRLWQ